MSTPKSLPELLAKYTFEKLDNQPSSKGAHGIFLVIGCRPRNDGRIECRLLDFGGAVDVGHAVSSSVQIDNWREEYGSALSVLVAKASLLECENILRDIHSLQITYVEE